MPDTWDDLTEAQPASEAPAVIPLPPPAAPLPPEPPPPRAKGRKGRHFGPRPVDDPRSARFEFRCTPAFLEKLEAAAEAAGLSIAGYICAELGSDPGPRVHRNPSEFKKLMAQGIAFLGRPGGNMNQCARALNELSIIAREIDADDLRRRIEDMEELYRQTYAEHRECVSEMMRLLGMRGFGR